MGVLVTLLLLLFAVQLVFDLYATSVVTGAGYDAARAVAGYESDQQRARAAAAATTELRRRLGAYGRDHLGVEWNLNDPEVVELRLTAVHPSVLPASLSGRTALGNLDRTIRVRRETR